MLICGLEIVLVIICPCLKSLTEAKVKRFGLIPLVEENSEQPSTASIVWSLVLTLMKIYNEKKQAEQIKIQNA